MDERLTKLTGSMVVGVRDQVDYLVERGDVDPNQIMLMIRGKARPLAVAARREQGKTPDEIAKEFGISRTQVYRDLAALRVVPNGTGEDENRKDNNGSTISSVPNGTDEHLSPLDQTRQDARVAIEAANEALSDVAVLEPQQTYETIVLDLPWPMEKIERDVRPNQVAFDYPIMSEAELREFGEKLGRMAADDCHLFMWTTQKFLPLAFELIDHYGFRSVVTMVWHKAGGYQPTGLPQYNCEFVVYARKGKPKFLSTQGFYCCFNGARREHSRKPDEFYDMIRLVTGGPRLDVFSREERDGFAQYGNESGKFRGAA